MITPKPDQKKPILLCDSAIYRLKDYFAHGFRLMTYEAEAFRADKLREAQGFLVRSVTPVTAQLLRGTPCRFVGSATAGLNHLDLRSLEANQIAWAHAPGANADAVVEYILSALYQANADNVLSMGCSIALIGCGEVGSRVLPRLSALGFAVHVYDPPKALREPGFESADLVELLNCEWAIFCASYHEDAPFSSHHLLNKRLLSDWGCLRGVINAARGELIDHEALFSCRQPIWTCLDVWPDEPSPDPHWIAQATIATPHIAGYSVEAKQMLSLVLYRACCEYFGVPMRSDLLTVLNKPVPAVLWSDTVGLRGISRLMKRKAQGSAFSFHTLRRHYPLRNQQHPYLLA